MKMQNNIFYIDGYYMITNNTSFTHTHNHYYLIGGTQLGFTLGPGELIAAPLFTNFDGKDYQLQSSSPAIDAGSNLGFTNDFNYNPVPFGAAPDVGAFEYQDTP